jgi:glycosyltransferase involved in cell wall biosynthesis
MLSVVIPTYRKNESLLRTLAALRAQWADIGERGEVVVVDDGSGDGIDAKLASWRKELPLRVLVAPQNEGRARARNRGWRAAHGDIVLFLDDDIALEPGALLAHLRAQDRTAAAYVGDVVTAPAIVDSSLFEYLDSRGAAKHADGAALPARYFLTQNVSLPRAALERVGGFDEAFASYGFEDMEIAFRLEEQAQLRFFRLAAARGAHWHHHSLAQYLQKKQLCGAASLPQLLHRHPARAREMSLDLVPGCEVATSWPRRLLRGALAFSLRCGLPRRLRRRLPAWQGGGRRLRHGLYNYLVLAAYADGLGTRRPANSGS